MIYNRCRKIIPIFILIFTLSACASKSVNLGKTGDISINVSNSESVKIVNVYVKQFEGEILIHADAKPIKATRFFHPGHLSFELIAADGKKYFNLDVTRYTREHNDSGRSKLKHVSFWVRMPMDIPKGSILNVTHHDTSVHENLD